jgi:hypothetical protein
MLMGLSGLVLAMRAGPVDENQDALKAKLAFYLYQLHYLH